MKELSIITTPVSATPFDINRTLPATYFFMVLSLPKCPPINRESIKEATDSQGSYVNLLY